MLDVPRDLVLYVSLLLREERARRGSRRHTRLLTCYKQALFVLAWFRDRPDVERLGCGFGLSRATSYRYRDEGVAVLATQAPDLHGALERAREEGLSHSIPDGKVVECDRVHELKTSRKGEEIDACYSGKTHDLGGLIQALMDPQGIPRWVSDVLPGSTRTPAPTTGCSEGCAAWENEASPCLSDAGKPSRTSRSARVGSPTWPARHSS
jgi:hypothetical protein